MMRFSLVLFFVLLFSSATFAAAPATTISQPPKSKDEFAKIGAGLVYEANIPNIHGGAIKDLKFDVFGGFRSSYLELFFDVNFANIFKDPNLSDYYELSYDYIYGFLNPRISFFGMADSKSPIPFLKDIFLAYEFDFDNSKGSDKGLLIHNMGLGISLDMPLFDYFNINIYSKYNELNYGRNNYQFDGWMLDVNYFLTFYELKSADLSFAYDSKMNWVFGTRVRYEDQTSESLQWSHRFRISWNGLFAAYTYQINVHYLQYAKGSSNSHAQSVGLYYEYKF